MKKTLLTIGFLLAFSTLNDYEKFSNSKLVIFNEVNLLKEMDKIGIRFKEIVLAQSKIETGHYQSKIFKSNNNLFGMKLARQRQTTAIGEQFNHAKYTNWIESLKDYKLWQDKYCKEFKSDDDYLNYLSDIYAEDKQYVKLIKQMI